MELRATPEPSEKEARAIEAALAGHDEAARTDARTAWWSAGVRENLDAADRLDARAP